MAVTMRVIVRWQGNWLPPRGAGHEHAVVLHGAQLKPQRTPLFSDGFRLPQRRNQFRQSIVARPYSRKGIVGLEFIKLSPAPAFDT